MSALFSCREAARLISVRHDRPLRPGERLSLTLHQAMCGACRAYARQVRFIDTSFRMRGRTAEDPLPTSEALGEAARERIRAALRRGHGLPAADSPGPAPIAPVSPPPTAPTSSQPRSRSLVPSLTADHPAPRRCGTGACILAMLFVAAAIGGTWFLQVRHCPSLGGRIQVAEAIAFHHRKQDPIEYRGATLAELARVMPRLDFAPRLPAALADAGIRIDGARYCTVGEAIAMQLFLHQDGVRKTLYLARAIPEIPAYIGRVTVPQGSTDVHLWREDGLFCGLAQDRPSRSQPR